MDELIPLSANLANLGEEINIDTSLGLPINPITVIIHLIASSDKSDVIFLQ